MSPDSTCAYRTHVNEAAASARALEGVAVCYAGDSMTLPLLPLPPARGSSIRAAGAGNEPTQQAAGLLCGAAAQLSYWILTDCVGARSPAHCSRAETEDHAVYAEKAAKLTALVSGCSRAGEGGLPTLAYTPASLEKVASLLKAAGDAACDIPETRAAERAAAQATLRWCEAALCACRTSFAAQGVTPAARGAKATRGMSPRTLQRIAAAVQAPADAYPQPVSERDLQLLFHRHDPEGSGWIRRESMQAIWEESHLSALPNSDKNLKDALEKYSANTDKVSYDEFAIIMFKLFNL
eukprot:Rhum_TRINITY_DN22050_c0_g1::Rhum_TRINITY_DN22050_c0_g1_i1::g.175166::m.175166